MKFLKLLHTGYGVIVFTILFFLLLPLMMIPILSRKRFRLVGQFNRWWAYGLFTLVGIPFTIKQKTKLDPSKQYIFCANHFSYLDIATMALNPHNTIFVGKNDMEKIPIFGFMYRKLHITVDRSKLKSRYSTMLKTMRALDEGKSLVIFPEGGIIAEKDPIMARFKDGAFRASIEKQIPIVPVTIPYNWIILPPNEFLLTWRPMEIILHHPVDPAQYTLDTIEAYKLEVKQTIEEALNQRIAENSKMPLNDNRSRALG